MKILHWLSENIKSGNYLISLMSQYTPMGKSADYHEINRRVMSFEYDSVVEEALKLGINILHDAYFQSELISAFRHDQQL